MLQSRMGSLPSLRRQHLLAEFAGLKQACPEGMFVSLTPGDPTLWSGVIFVRKGPYATAILRFQISFPDAYPRLPPLVTFSTDMFHPLITPLTTYTYTTDIQDNGTVSATDEERLPPGGFSLRHGFPGWFGRGKRGARSTSGSASAPRPSVQTPPRTGRESLSPAQTTPESRATPAGGVPSYKRTDVKQVSTYDVLRYIRSTFDDENVLDSVPLEAAGNPGAWHAWRSKRKAEGKVFDGSASWHDGLEEEKGGRSENSPTGRRPAEWNWEGVWEDRVRNGMETSLSEAVLYGGAGAGDDVIRFLPMEQADVDAIKDNLLRTIGDHEEKV